MATTDGMSQLSIEEQTKRAYSRMTEEAATPESSKRPRDAGLHASQLYDNKLSGVEAVKEQVKKELELLEEEAKQLDELGHHKEAGMMRTTARRLRGEIDMPPQAGDASAAQTSDAVWHSPSDLRLEDSFYYEFVGLLRSEAERRAVPVSVDSLTTKQWLEMQSTAILEIAIAEEPLVTEETCSLSNFWGDSDRRTDNESLIHHLNKIIPPENTETEWVNSATDYPRLLSHHTLGYNISATSGVLAADRSAVQAGLPENGMRLLLDIRQAIAASDINQAQARLLLANLRSRESRAVLMLTDLCEEWHAMWLDASTIYQHTFASWGQAVRFMKVLLAGRFDRELSQTSFAKRRQMDDRLYAICTRDKAFAEQVEFLSRQ